MHKPNIPVTSLHARVVAGLSLLFSGMGLHAQSLTPGYIDWGDTGTHFSSRYWDWQPGSKFTADDNFFISRVRPHQRFRDTLTQVDPSITDATDRELCMWMPIGTIPYNALPDGVFDRDVFNMWQYVTHLGDWSASYLRLPGAITDIAHKNGVGVSATATIPYGLLQSDWRTNLQNMVDLGASKMASYLNYYGIDGFGYNSEFSSSNIKFMNALLGWHQSVLKTLRKTNPVSEIIWYDGTNSSGACTYDQGLGDHNVATFGRGGAERSNLFLNYNWNDPSLLQRTMDYAAKIDRDTHDIYCGFNLQGGEPRSGSRWTMLKDYPFSIGLWGAHNENMFYESRSENGNMPEEQQSTYLCRLEKWFTNSNRNPIDTLPLNNSLSYSTSNTDFAGMSALMTARSALSWNLTEEPFVTSFSLGNGKAFYWHGVPTSGEWYNIGTQDYLPTWRWWFARHLLGRTKEEVPTGITASLTWDDAWNGGSCLQLEGTDSGQQYLHLFKTLYTLQGDDRITVITKRVEGMAEVSLVLTDAEGCVARLPLKMDNNASDEWVSTSFSITQDAPQFAGNTLRLMALEISNADRLQLRLGHLALLRGDYPQPAAPLIESAQILLRHGKGCDGKLIWHMPNDLATDKVCYNLDVNTSMFRLYAQTDDGDPVSLNTTTSWAGILFSIPLGSSSRTVRFGVSAIGLDMETESAISWSDWQTIADAPQDETAIHTPIAPSEDNANRAYDLLGRPTSPSHKTLYLSNSRKFLNHSR